jgi:hypothetical protein
MNSTPDTDGPVGKTDSQNLTPIGNHNRRKIEEFVNFRLVGKQETMFLVAKSLHANTQVA